MRTILIAIFLLIYAVISIPLYVIELIIGKINPKLKVKTAQAIVVFTFKLILFLAGTKLTVIGKERVPKDQAVLFVSNHRSYLDTLAIYTTTPHLTGFVAKKEMEKVPCISTWMRYMNCVFLDRSNPREGLKSILQGIEHIKNGYSMFIAPEGTRNQKDEMLPFKEGSLKMAEKTGCPIVPIALNNTDAIYEKQAPWVKKAHIIIEYCEPIPVAKLSKEERKQLLTNVQSVIKDTIERNKTLV